MIFELYWTCLISTVVGPTVFGDNYRDRFTPNTSQTRQDNLIIHKIIGHLSFLVGTLEQPDYGYFCTLLKSPCSGLVDGWLEVPSGITVP